MSFGFSFSNTVKAKLCKYLIQRNVGEYLGNELSLDQLTVEILNGTGSIQNVPLNCTTVNKKFGSVGLPFMLVDGFVENIAVSIPWSSLVIDDTSIEISGLQLTLQPRQNANSAYTDLDASQWLSQSQMSTTSLHLAEECLKDETTSKSLPYGLDAFAKTIESVLSRMRVTLIDAVIRLESCPPEATQGIALELRIGKVEFFDESSKDLGSSVDDDDGAHTDTSLYSIKNIHISGNLSLHTDMFLPCHRSRAHTLSDDSTSSTLSSDIFSSAISSHSPIVRQPSYVSSSRTAESLPQEHSNLNSDPVKFFSATGEQRIKLKIKNDEKVPGPKSSLEVQLSSIGIFLIPKQVYLLSELAKAFTEASK